MSRASQLMLRIEKQFPVQETLEWEQLKSIIAKEFPELISMHIGTVYTMSERTSRRRMVVTKENGKTWVMYEVEGSYRPGCRWMITKTWCTKENITRDSIQSYEFPKGLKLK